MGQFQEFFENLLRDKTDLRKILSHTGEIFYQFPQLLCSNAKSVVKVHFEISDCYKSMSWNVFLQKGSLYFCHFEYDVIIFQKNEKDYDSKTLILADILI